MEQSLHFLRADKQNLAQRQTFTSRNKSWGRIDAAERRWKFNYSR